MDRNWNIEGTTEEENVRVSQLYFSDEIIITDVSFFSTITYDLFIIV